MQETNFIIDIIKNLKLFSDLPFQALSALSLRFQERVFSLGETIFSEGETGNSLLVIISGEVRISQTGASGSCEEALVVFKKGDFFGEMALLEDLPRSATAIAHTDVYIMEISRDQLMEFIYLDPVNGNKILLKLAKDICSRLREADIKIKTFVNLSQWL